MKKAILFVGLYIPINRNIALAQKQLENPCMSSQRFVSQQKKLYRRTRKMKHLLCS